MIPLRFDTRDIFRSARVAFSFQRLWIQFLGLSWGYVAYVIFTYAAKILAGDNFSDLWARYGLLPYILDFSLPWYSIAVFALGLFFLLFAWLISSTAVCRATYMQLKGNTFYTWKEALAFAFKKKGGSVLSTPIAIGIIAVLIGAGGVVVGLLGRIPVVGPIGLSLFTVIWFVAALLLIFVLLALVVSLILTPAILATTDDDAFEGIFQSFSLLHAQPWRILFSEALIKVIALFGFGIFAFFVKRAWALMTTIFIWGMGKSYADLSYSASYHLQNWLEPAATKIRALGEWSGLFFFNRVFDSLTLPVSTQIASWIFAFFLLLIAAFVVAYPLAVFNAGQTLLFIILKKKKDDENLLERKDKEEVLEDEIQALESPKEEVEKKKAAPRPVKRAVKKAVARAKPKPVKKSSKKKR